MRFPLNEFYVSGPYVRSSNRMLIGTFREPQDTNTVAVGRGVVEDVSEDSISLTIVEDNRKLKVTYRPVSSVVSRGDKVEQGQCVATMKKPHLILSIVEVKGEEEVPLNPMSCLYRHLDQYNLHNIPAYTPRVKPLTPYKKRKIK